MRMFFAALAVIFGSTAALAADAVAVRGGETYNRGTIAPAPSTNPFAGLYLGADVGAESNDFTIDAGNFGYISGINADGFRGNLIAGYNACISDGCFGVEGNYGISDANVHVGPLGDILQADDHIRLFLTGKYRIGNSYVGARGGYEWQDWTAGGRAFGGETDASTGWWVVGGELGTMVTGGGVIRLTVDYATLDSVDVDGLSGAGNDAITKALDESDKITVGLGVTYHTGFGQSLTSLIDR